MNITVQQRPNTKPRRLVCRAPSCNESNPCRQEQTAHAADSRWSVSGADDAGPPPYLANDHKDVSMDTMLWHALPCGGGRLCAHVRVMRDGVLVGDAGVVCSAHVCQNANPAVTSLASSLGLTSETLFHPWCACRHSHVSP